MYSIYKLFFKIKVENKSKTNLKLLQLHIINE